MSRAPLSIKVFLPKGEPDKLRIAEISNWSGKALACSRSELSEVCRREEAERPGVYLLLGTDPDSGEPMVYIGEAEEIGKRLKQQLAKDFWVQVVFFISKDESLTRSHIRYLEGELIRRGTEAGRAVISNSQSSGSKLPESDRAEMDVFLDNALQLLPVIGTSAFVLPVTDEDKSKETLQCKIKGLTAHGQRTPGGFVVFKGSEAVLKERPSGKYAAVRRKALLESGVLVEEGGHLVFTKDYEFTSPSVAGTIVRGGNTNGLTAWKTPDGRSLRELEEQSN